MLRELLPVERAVAFVPAYLGFRRFFLAGGRMVAFAAAPCWRRSSAAIIPRAAPAQALAALSQMLSRGFFFVSGLAIVPSSGERSGNAVGSAVFPAAFVPVRAGSAAGTWSFTSCVGGRSLSDPDAFGRRERRPRDHAGCVGEVLRRLLLRVGRPPLTSRPPARPPRSRAARHGSPCSAPGHATASADSLSGTSTTARRGRAP